MLAANSVQRAAGRQNIIAEKGGRGQRQEDPA